MQVYHVNLYKSSTALYRDRILPNRPVAGQLYFFSLFFLFLLVRYVIIIITIFTQTI